MEKSKVAIIIPALNESATIKHIVSSVKKYGVVIVVDDGSTDDTANIAIQEGAFVIIQKNSGYDVAINSGFKKANELKANILITMDADGQHNPLDILQFIQSIEMGNDIVVGIRNYQQRISEKLFSSYTKLRYGIEDPLCGMKAYKSEIYERLGYFDSFHSVGTELMLYGAYSGGRIGQVSLKLNKRTDNPRFGTSFFANYKILRALLKSICRYY